MRANEHFTYTLTHTQRTHTDKERKKNYKLLMGLGFWWSTISFSEAMILIFFFTHLCECDSEVMPTHCVKMYTQHKTIRFCVCSSEPHIHTRYSHTHITYYILVVHFRRWLKMKHSRGNHGRGVCASARRKHTEHSIRNAQSKSVSLASNFVVAFCERTAYTHHFLAFH